MEENKSGENKMKKTVFYEFGDWCVANNVLQSTEGVW